MTAAELADTSDPRFTDDQRAAVARFEAAPTPPEVVEARVVEEVARALFDATYDRGVWDNATAWGQHCRDDARRLAAAAVAAYRAAQDGGAEEAVRRVEALATVWEGVANTWQETADHPNAGPEFRAHCLAERDDFRDRVTVLRAVVATRTGR